MRPDIVNFSNLKARIRENLGNWRQRLTRLGADSVYLFVSSAALSPLALAIAQQSPALSGELWALLGSLGGNLLANVLQTWRDADDEAAMMRMLQEALEQTPELQQELDAALEKLEVMSLARQQLTEADREWFTAKLQAELAQMGNWPRFKAQVMAIGEGAQAVQARDQATVVAGDMNINITTQTVASAFWDRLPTVKQDLRPATSQYLAYLAHKYRYLDFRGMGVSDRVPLRLPLLQMYVPLQARIEMPEGETWARDLHVAGRQVSEEEAEMMGRRMSEPQAVLALLQQQPGLIILGDPGAGKTTFLKYLALRLALGDEIGISQRLPLLLPLSAYATVLSQKDVPLDQFIADYYHNLLGAALPVGEMLAEALQQGRALLLLDGLDEVKAVKQRRVVVDRVAHFFAWQQQRGNKFILTSRIVGYREVRPTTEGLTECTLVDFDETEIKLFVNQWTQAMENAAQGETEVASSEARREEQELLLALQHNPGVRRLAANPLLLTILALMKRQGVALPERRVELYEQYVRTLLKHWNLARGLDRPPERDLDVVETVRVLAPLALWMHETSPGVGLLKQTALRRRLVEIYAAREWPEPEKAARQLLRDARDHAGLLVERGQGMFGFIHLTFQEYLAAVAIAQKGQLKRQRIVEILGARLADDNWHEVMLLAIGYLGIVQQSEAVASEVLRLLIAQAPNVPGQVEIMAGEAVADTWPGGVTHRCRAEVKEALLAAMRADARIEPKQRAKAGQVLARLGDPRAEVMEVDGMQFCYVPPGPFWMGSDDGNDNEKPQHWLALEDGYWLGRFPVTNGQYRGFVEDDGYLQAELWEEAQQAGYWQPRKGFRDRLKAYEPGFPFDLANHPVVAISWYEALAFTRWLSQRWREAGWLPMGYHVCLPSEAEWEKGARGGVQIPKASVIASISELNDVDVTAIEMKTNGRSQTKYIWGDKLDPNRANYRASSIGTTNAVGCFPNGLSAYGMEEVSGNMFEWTRSKYAAYEYDMTDGRERIDASGDVRILRGGYYSDRRGDWLRCAYRYWSPPHFDVLDTRGMRVCVSPFTP